MNTTQEATRPKGHQFHVPALPNEADRYRVIKPFTSYPVVIRHVLFRHLKAREVALYMAITLSMDAKGITFASNETLAEMLDLQSANAVSTMANRLVELGWLAKGKMTPSGSTHSRRFFQRPSLRYTLNRLVELGLLSAEDRDKYLRVQNQAPESGSDPDSGVDISNGGDWNA